MNLNSLLNNLCWILFWNLYWIQLRYGSCKPGFKTAIFYSSKNGFVPAIVGSSPPGPPPSPPQQQTPPYSLLSLPLLHQPAPSEEIPVAISSSRAAWTARMPSCAACSNYPDSSRSLYWQGYLCRCPWKGFKASRDLRYAVNVLDTFGNSFHAEQVSKAVANFCRSFCKSTTLLIVQVAWIQSA